MRKICLGLVTLMLASIFTACSSNSNAITAAEFTAKFVENGYDVSELEAEAMLPGVTNEHIAKKDNILIDFTVIENEEAAINFFTTAKTMIESLDDGTAKVELKENSRFTFKKDESYYYISKVGNTVLYASGMAADEDEIDKMMKEIGYK